MSEVFKYPTVKEVAFEIKFPHLFSIENRIGDFQDKIILQFPDSAQVFHRQLMFADTGLEGKIETVPERFKPNMVKKAGYSIQKARLKLRFRLTLYLLFPKNIRHTTTQALKKNSETLLIL